MDRTRTRARRPPASAGSVNQLRPRLAKWLDELRSSYWFLPGLLVVISGGLAGAAVHLDHQGLVDPARFPGWIRFAEPAGARALLTTTAGAMVTIVSLTFSISIVSLTLASSQFGSRLLYNFMRDRSNQAVLGVLLGTFVYCLLVLSAVRSGGEARPPQLALTIALALALVSVGALIFFIHHVAESIQAPIVIRNVGRDLHTVIDRNMPLPDQGGNGHRSDGDDARASDESGVAVLARSSGILQAIGEEALLAQAVSHDVELCLFRRPGDYVMEGSVVARVRGTTEVSQELEDGIVGALILGGRRTLVQDVEFGFYQLVEIAVRALSPGVNDPFTAISCINELANALGRVAARDELVGAIEDPQGRVRVWLDVTDFDGMTSTAFDQIRQQARHDPAVMIHLLETLRRVAPLMRDDRHRAAIRRQGRMAHELAVAHTSVESDREALDERLGALEEILDSSRAPRRP